MVHDVVFSALQNNKVTSDILRGLELNNILLLVCNVNGHSCRQWILWMY